MVDQEERDRLREANKLILGQIDRICPYDPMHGALEGFREITFAAHCGVPPREVYMESARAAIRDLAGGHDVPHDWSRCPSRSSDVYVQAAYDASYELWMRAADLNRAGHMPCNSYLAISSADNLVRFDCVDHRESFVAAVDRYLGEASPEVSGICERVTVEEAAGQKPQLDDLEREVRRVTFHMPPDRLPWKAAGNPDELPTRLIFSPPATVAFWSDGTKTVAKCDAGDRFDEFTGLCVCIAKRHVPRRRRRTFDDEVRKVLKRAERVEPKRRNERDER